MVEKGARSASPPLRTPPIKSAARGSAQLSHGVNRDIIKELAERGPRSRPALAARLHTSPTKVHECLTRLQKARAVAARRGGRAPEYRLTECGRGLHATTAIVRRWFRAHPGHPLTPSVGWRAFADLGEAWQAGLVEWIVRREPTVEDAARGPGGLGPRRPAEALEAMQEAGMLTARKGRDGRARHRLTLWAARGIGILAAIARWEREWDPPGAVPIEVEDAVVAILATLPLVRLPADAAGIFTFAAQTDGEGTVGVGTVWARVRGGRVVAAGEGTPPGRPAGWVIGPFAGWFAAALDGNEDGLHSGGRSSADAGRVVAIVRQMHAQLFKYE